MAQAPIPDTWLKEFEEAMQLADDIAAPLRERDLIIAAGGDPSHIVASTRRKITVLGTCLDRLESLLQNPPAKPSVNEEELYQRQDMLLGIRFKTKQMAASFSTSQASNRVTPLGEGSGKEAAERSGTRDLEGYGISRISKQPIQGIDENLLYFRKGSELMSPVMNSVSPDGAA